MGYAVMLGSSLVESGTWRFGNNPGGEQWQALLDNLRELVVQYAGKQVIIVYEKASFMQKSTNAGHLSGAWKAMLELFAHQNREVSNIVAVNVGTWKKDVVGKGNAKKPEIVSYVCTKYKKTMLVSADNNEADAICLAEYGYIHGNTLRIQD